MHYQMRTKFHIFTGIIVAALICMLPASGLAESTETQKGQEELSGKQTQLQHDQQGTTGMGSLEDRMDETDKQARQARERMREQQAGAERQPPDRQVESAASTLKNMMDRTGEKIPPEILSEAEAVAIFPEVTKVGVVVGGRYGSGALMLQQNGQWNGPVFLSLYGASVGAQLGVEQTDLIMIFNNRESIRELQDGALEFGAEASVAAGPYGEYAKASTQADILAYKQTEGAFAGIALSSGYIAIDNESNRR